MKKIASAVGALSTVGHEISKIIRREINYRRFKPTHALFFITYRCTCRCQSCVMWQKEGKMHEELSLAEWIATVDTIAGYGLQDIELFGGDALLRPDVLIPLIRHIHEKGIHTNTTVNANLLDRKMAAALVGSGLDDFNVSIDAIGPLHDRMRGIDGLFEKARQGIAYMVEARGKSKKPELAINATISAANMDQIEGLVEHARLWGMDSVNLEPFGSISQESIENSTLDGLVPKPYFTNTEKSLNFTRQQADDLKRRLVELKKKVQGTGIYVTSKNIDILSADELSSCRFSNKRCTICRNKIIIDPVGNVLPCSFYDSYKLGNIRSEKFKNIWANKLHREFVRQQTSGSIAMCRECVFGVQRNRSIGQSLMGIYLTLTKRAR